MPDQNVIDKVKELGPWVHQIDLGNGIRTRDIFPKSGRQPPNHPKWRWDRIDNHLPTDMTGMRVLDIGCADGFFSIECARRGADVLAIDSAPNNIAKASWAAGELGLPNIEFRNSSVHQVDGSLGDFDFALLLAVLYHLRDPLGALERIGQVTSRLFLETIVELDSERSFMTLIPPPGESNSPKWIPSTKCVIEMLSYSGFKQVREITEPGLGRPICDASKSA